MEKLNQVREIAEIAAYAARLCLFDLINKAAEIGDNSLYDWEEVESYE